MKPLVVFGTGQIAELALHYFRTDSDRDVIALTVDRDFVSGDSRWGLPVIPFEDLGRDLPPQETDIFIALSYSKRNRIRKAKFLAAEAAGYGFATYVSSHATVLSPNIGRNCFILEDNTVQPFVTIGDDTTLWSGNHIGHHSSVGNHVFIASHVVVSGGVTIEDEVFIGVNATVRNGIKVGRRAVVGAGALVMDAVHPDSVVVAEPTPAADPRRRP